MNTSSEYYDRNAGLDGWGDDTVRIPYRSLTQSMTRVEGMDEVPRGIFLTKSTKENFGRTMDIVVLKARRYRALFYEYTEGKKGKKCWSDDGKTPAVDVENPQSTNCAGCPFEKKDQHAALLCLDVPMSLEAGEPIVFWFDVKGTSLYPVQGYVNSILQRRKALPQFKATLSSSQKKNDKGTWYVPEFSNIELVPSNVEPLVRQAFELYVSGGAAVDQAEGEVDPTQTEDDTPF